MTSTPRAALAVVKAAVEDAPLAELLNRPGWTARRIADALEREGWTITRTPVENAPQKPAQTFVTN
ncbi:hypothetical protein ACOKM5_24350 [Streptomyces sp. BH097]|uniref:hypothetical protein n=1 Tax=Streptomyces sp. BH097 TaxID=3410406 RepID=UPI003CED6617